MENKRENKYSDIINLPHHVSATRPHMTIIDRAAQFSPFAALTGYEAAIEETGRVTESFAELDENRKERINEKLQWIKEHLKEETKISVIYFQPDEKKEGGRYVEVTGAIKKIDEFERCILMMDGMKVLLNHIYDIEFNV